MKKIVTYLIAIFMLIIGVNVVKAEESYDYDKLLNDYIEKWKKVEITGSPISTLGEAVEITTDGEKVNLIGDDDYGNVYKTNFVYNDGILTYVPLIKIESSEDLANLTNEEMYNLFWDNFLAFTSLAALADLKGYDNKKLEEWLEQNKENLTLEKDGIEAKTIRYENSGQNEDGSYDILMECMISLKLDLKNGLKSFEEYNKNNPTQNDQTQSNTVNKEENNKNNSTPNNNVKVENPKTGIDYQYGFLIALVLISAISYIVLRKKSKFIKHN